MNIRKSSIAHTEKKNQRSEDKMNKKIMKKCVGTLMASLLLTTCSTAIVGAQMTQSQKTQNTELAGVFSSLITEEQLRCALNTTNNHHLNDTILLKVKELTEQGIHLEQIQNELQNMLNNISRGYQNRGKHSVSLRGFYGVGIFSCRGFA
jgi:uncharacterized lipoprotein YajG